MMIYDRLIKIGCLYQQELHHSNYDKMANGRLLYNLHVNVANAILEHGIIFGGYVRDTLLHNHNADKFYTKVCDEEDVNTLYSDSKVYPEYADRLLLPQDIDCYMTSGQLEKLVSYLKNSNRFALLKRRDIVCTSSNKYMVNLRGAPLGLMLTQLVVGLVHNPIYEGYLTSDIRHSKVYVDVLHAPNLEDREPPFGDMDFECNCLVMDKIGNVRLSSRLASIFGLHGYPLNQHQKLCQIVDDIVARKAEVVTAASFDRTSKMVTKGWKVKDGTMSIMMCTEDEICPICFDDTKNQMRIKATCCSSKYHPQCFARFVSYDSGVPLACPTCRTFMPRDGLLSMKVKMWP